MAAASCALPDAASRQSPVEQTTAASSSPARGPAATQGPITDIMNKGAAADSEPAAPLPQAAFRHPDYYAMPGQKITFDVSPSLPAGVSAARYEWDFDGDGVIDEVSPVPVAAHTFPDVFEGTAEVRITFFTGGSSTASAAVHIGRGPRDGLPAEIGVVGFTAGMGMGESASVTLPAREG